MILSVTVSDELVRESQDRGYAVIDYVEMLIDKGREATRDKAPVLESAIDRIRKLRMAEAALRR